MFSNKDLNQIAERGSDLELVKLQIENFRNGFPSLELTNIPEPGKGILVVNNASKNQYINYYDEKSTSLDILKFVPASGAATRMFKSLFAFLAEYDHSESAYNQLIKEGEKNPTFKFLKNLEKFAFYDDLKAKYQELHGESLQEGHLKRKYTQIIDTLLSENGLGYGSLPKALLKFHQYPNGASTPLQEHFVEGAKYAKGAGSKVNLHFTVSPQHQSKFELEVAAIKDRLEQKYQVTYQVSYSIQKPATDTIAVDMENNPFRNTDDSILFRPAGHGALLENLNDLNADVIFIKNIDNVVPENLQSTTYEYKKVLAGILLTYTDKIASYLTELESVSENSDLSTYENFLFNELMITDSTYSLLDPSGKIKYLFNKLNRPVRTCGIVINQGDTGGGPFFAKNPDGTISAQIAETAQIDKSVTTQEEIFNKATHFNPADLACSTKDYKGKPFDLLKFRDSNTGFITEKSKDGKNLKAQELPGLWNGSMSDWITVFVEVPIVTFNPVKSINDLLNAEHQS